MVGIPIAVVVLYPWFGLALSLMLAALAMHLRPVSAVSNAVHVRRASLV